MSDRLWAQILPPPAPTFSHFSPFYFMGFIATQFNLYKYSPGEAQTPTLLVNQSFGNVVPPLATDGTFIYYANNSRQNIGRYNPANNTFADLTALNSLGAGGVSSMVCDMVNKKLIINQGGAGRTCRCNLDGSVLQAPWLATTGALCIDPTGSSLLMQPGAVTTIDKRDLTTGAVTNAGFWTGFPSIGTISCDTNFIYATTQAGGTAIARAPITGGAATQILSGLVSPNFIVANGTSLYFVETAIDNGFFYLAACNPDGTGHTKFRAPAGIVSSGLGGMLPINAPTYAT